MAKDSTRLYGVIGYPIQHSLSPAIHNAAFAAVGMDALYTKWEVAPGRLGRTLKRLHHEGVQGLNITLPHKVAALKAALRVSARARAVGAANTLKRTPKGWEADNTDGFGFLRALLESSSWRPKSGKALLLGAGGAGRAVSSALLDAGCENLVIADWSRGRASALVRRLRARKKTARIVSVAIEPGALMEALDPRGLLVNATPMGLKAGDPLPFPAKGLGRGNTVFDLVYNPVRTPLIQAAGRAKAKAVTGEGMLLYQAVEAWESWTGLKAPVSVMRKALMQAL